MAQLTEVHAVIRDMGGWTKMCETATEELPFRANEFSKRYRGYRVESPYPPKLLGRTETQNQAAGYLKYVEPAVLIGDQRRAQLVHDKGDAAAGTLQIGTMPNLRLLQKGDAA